MPEIYNNAPHLMKTDLLNRGWTTTSINRYLPHPIVEYRRSHRGTYSVHLWPQSTIESAETSAEVRGLHRHHQKEEGKCVADSGDSAARRDPGSF